MRWFVHSCLQFAPMRRGFGLSRQLILVFFIFLVFLTSLKAQEAVVSSYFNSSFNTTSTQSEEWTELLVIQDNLDMRNWTLGDNNSVQLSWQTPIIFKNIPFWEHMRAGTIILIWHRSKDAIGNNYVQDINPNDGYIELAANNLTYFSGGDFTTSNQTLVIAGAGDLLQLKNASGNHVHALGHIIAVPAAGSFNSISGPKLNHTANLAANSAVFIVPGTNLASYGTLTPLSGTNWTSMATGLSNSPLVSFGLPNSNTAWSFQNKDFWYQTRQPVWSTPTLTATPNGGFTQVTLSWNTSVDPYASDGTQGYIILRNTINSFTAPSDGTSYASGSIIGSATVVANITPSSITSFTDNISLSCGENLYYQVYVFRYNDDNTHGNNYDAARGRAYNQLVYAEAATTGPSAPSPPTSASVNPVSLCENDPGNITLTAIGGSGTTLEWLEGSCTGTTVGVGNVLSILSPAVTTTYFVRWTSPGCSPSSCVDVTITVTPAPTTADAGPDQSKCGVLTTNLTANNPATGTGIWSFVSGPGTYTFGNQSLYNTSFTATITGIYILRWTITNGTICTESSDEVSIEFSNNITVIAGSNSPVCSGENINLTSSIAGATYLWSGPNGFSSTLQNPLPVTNAQSVNAGSYSVTVSNVPGGCPGSTNSTTIIVNNRPNTPQINNIATGVQDVCVGYMYPYTIEPPAAGSVYVWSLSGGGFITNTASTNLINITWTTTGNYVLSVMETASNGCTGNPVILNITVSSVSIAGVSISASSNPVCTGNPVTITALPVNQGTSPDYIWYKNNIQAGAPNLPTYTYIPDDGDQVYVELSSSSPCALPNPVSSQVITMSVNSSLVPTITISASNNPSCFGSTVDFSVTTSSNGGSSPVYEWKKNGLPIGTNSPTYSDNTLANNDLITCTLTSNESCASPPQGTSNEIKMTVNPITDPTITVSADIDPSCTGNLVTFTATISNGGNMPVYQWGKNGSNVGANSQTYTDNLLANNDVINCTLTSNASCISTGTVQGNPITLTVNPVPSVSDTSSLNPSVCGGIDGSISISGLMASALYQVDYNFNGLPVSTSKLSDGSGVLIIDSLSAGNFSTINITLNGCSSVPFDVNLNDPGATAAPTILSNSFSICPGESAGMSATGCNGTVTWSDGATGANNSVSPLATTYYTATCTFNGCTSAPSEQVEVIVKPRPEISGYFVTPPTSFCIPDGIITLMGLHPDTEYIAYFTYGVTPVTHSGNTLANGWYHISGCQPDTYHNITVELDGCRSEPFDAVVDASDNPLPPVITTSADTVCPGQTAMLTAHGCSGVITWSDGSTGNTLATSLIVNSDFSATCTESSCESAPGNTITIVLAPADFAGISGMQNVCTSGEISLIANGDAILYEWTTPKGVKVVNQNLSLTGVVLSDSGYYQLVSTNIVGCTDADSIRITVNTPPEIQISSDKDFCAGTQQNLQTGAGFSSYLWSDGSVLSSLSAIDEGQYWVKVTDASGCVVSDTTALVRCEENIFIPTAFSPNGDGTNEVFRPVTGNTVLLEYSISIYNRWGQLIFESNNYQSGWDGTQKGQYVLPGLYTYVISYKLADQSKPDGFSKTLLRGTVLLVR